MNDKLNPTTTIGRFIAIYIPIEDKDQILKLRENALEKCDKYNDVVVKLGDIEKEFEIDDFLQRLGF